MQAVLMLGGRGERLRPLTDKLPKPMVPVYKKPFLEHLIGLLKSKGIKDYIFCTGYLSKIIENYFKDGKRFGINIQYSIEKEPIDTGGALKQASDLLQNRFFIINGDTYINIDYLDLFRFSKNKEVMVVFDNTKKVYTIKNNLTIGKNNMIIKYDKEHEGEATCIDAGVQCFSRDILKLIEPNKKISLEREIFPKVIAKNRMYGYLTTIKYYDIGTFEGLENYKVSIL